MQITEIHYYIFHLFYFGGGGISLFLYSEYVFFSTTIFAQTYSKFF